MHSQASRMSLALAVALAFAMVSLGLFVVAPAARATHDTVSWSDPMTVISTPGFTRDYERILSDHLGNIYVFYISSASGVSNLNVTKYALTGVNGAPVKLFDKQVNDVSNVVYDFLYAVTIDHAGNLYVAWTRTTATLALEVYVSTSTNGGVTWQASVRANAPNAAGSDYFPSIAAAPDGTVYVTWYQSWGGTTSVSLSHSTDGGQTFGGWMNVTSPTSLWYPLVATDSGGRVYLVYGTFSGIVSTSWSDDGITWAPWQDLTTTSFEGIIPAVYVDSGRVVHVAWFSYTGSNYVMRYSQSADRGLSWSGSIPITGATGGGYIGYMAGEGDTVAFVWGDFSSRFGFAYSGDHGTTWYPETYVAQPAFTPTYVAADHNGTFWVGYSSGAAVYIRWWNGPPSMPGITGVAASGASGLVVTWTPSPEQNVASYQVWRSADGSTYVPVATLPATATSFTDSGLSNGTYFYKVVAVNVYGTESHESGAFPGTVGPTTQQLIDALNAEIAALQDQLAEVNATSSAAIAAARAQITSLQTQLTQLQNSEAANNAATAAQIASLQANITALQNRLNDIQAQQATQTMSYANLAFEVIVVVLLVVLLINQMRRPKQPRMMMAQPGQVQAPKAPEDEL